MCHQLWVMQIKINTKHFVYERKLHSAPLSKTLKVHCGVFSRKQSVYERKLHSAPLSKTLNAELLLVVDCFYIKVLLLK